jgi:hypothetical protein
MTAPKRTDTLKTTPPTQSPSPQKDSLTEAINTIASGFQEAIDGYRRAAISATKKEHAVEATILFHLAARLSAPGDTLEAIAQTLGEVNELNSWLPIPSKHRSRCVIERKAWQIRFIRDLKVSPPNERLLISSATQSPGRPAETRGVAVRAMESRNKGQNWKQIEERLLPHRRGAKNLGRSINREVQLLKNVLDRYGVSLEGYQGISAPPSNPTANSK